ncbi:MAG: enoyl-CoA hydratase/isomerase family protein [bacterium]
MEYRNIELTVNNDNVAVLKMNRPDRANCLSQEMQDELGSALDELAERNDAKCIVLTGTEKVFCAGLDLTELSKLTKDSNDEYTNKIATLFEKAFFHCKPTIAAVSGGAWGGGFDIAALCDIRIASETAVFCQPELRLAVNPILSPLWMNIGLARAKELAFTADPIDAREAYRIGLANHVYPVGKYMAETLKLAARIARHDAGALKKTKDLINQLTANTISNALEMQFEYIAEGFGGEANSRAAAGILNSLKNK